MISPCFLVLMMSKVRGSILALHANSLMPGAYHSKDPLSVNCPSRASGSEEDLSQVEITSLNVESAFSLNVHKGLSRRGYVLHIPGLLGVNHANPRNTE
jgi:hypothetical protein